MDAYTFVEYNTHMGSAITESNVKIANDSLEYMRSSHYQLRTFPLILSTMALLKHPDKIMTRMLYDYKVCAVGLYGDVCVKTVRSVGIRQRL